MRWTERQQAMLREMGVVLWARPDGGDAASAAMAEAAVDVAVVERPAPTVHARPQAPAVSERVALYPAATQVQADWLLVGEAFDPDSESGAAEARLLDNMLRSIGLSRSGKTPAERAAFETVVPGSDWSARVEAVQPRCIVAFGRQAAAALLDTSEPIGALRGSVHVRGAVPVIVTFAPSYLMRHPADKAKAWADLCLAVRTLQARSH